MRPSLLLLLLAGLLAISTASSPAPKAGTFAITNAWIVPVESPPFHGSLLVENGKIAALGPGLALPRDVRKVDAQGGWLVPGFVDPHSHMGIYPFPGAPAHSDGNEASDPITPQVRTLDAIHLDDPAFSIALTGGITTVFVIPGSANLIGGQGCLIKLRPGAPLAERVVKEAGGVKMALGENPKRTYGGRNQLPATRLGVAAGLREAFVAGQNYKQKWDRHAEALRKYAERHAAWLAREERDLEDEPQVPDPPAVDLKLEVLKDILERKLPVHIHCHRADDILTALRLQQEFGFDLAALHHATEAYLVTDEIRAAGVPVVVFATYWAGIKLETDNMTPRNAALCHDAGLTVSLHSDHPVVSQEYLRDEAALAAAQGLGHDEALKAITLTPARLLRIDDRVGSLAVGKDADLVLFSGDPLDIQQQVQRVWVDGHLTYDRDQGGVQGGPQPPAVPYLGRTEPWC